jgi:hypothetical protein
MLLTRRAIVPILAALVLSLGAVMFSEQVSPNFWTDPTNGIPYYIAVQTPQYQVGSMRSGCCSRPFSSTC